MGKKSRRQRETGGGTLQMKPDKRVEQDHWRHEDGSPIKTEEIQKLYRAIQITGQLQGFEQAQEEFKHEYILSRYTCHGFATNIKVKGV